MMHLHDFHAINVFGVGAALIGIAGIGVTAQACREALVIPPSGERIYVLAAMTFIMSVNLLITGIGCWITMLDMQIGGGAHG
jgi:hypothetical protein